MEELLKQLASEYIETQDRDKRIVVSRYVYGMHENPKSVRDMGFVQFLVNKIPISVAMALTDASEAGKSPIE